MKFAYCTFFSIAILFACNNHPTPVSKNIHKTTVVVNGKKDSVINNSQQNYGTATIPGICVKTLLRNIQATVDYKKISLGATNIKYAANWVKAESPEVRTNGSKITNGIQIVITNGKQKLGAYIYNNEDGKLYFVNNSNQYDKLNADSNSLKQIRNGCYWGVASHK